MRCNFAYSPLPRPLQYESSITYLKSMVRIIILILRPATSLCWSSWHTDVWMVNTAPFAAFRSPAKRRLRSAERKSTAPTTALTQQVRPPVFCHCWSVRVEQSPGPCPQSEPYRSCFQAPAKDIFIRTVLAHLARKWFTSDTLYKSSVFTLTTRSATVPCRIAFKRRRQRQVAGQQCQIWIVKQAA